MHINALLVLHGNKTFKVDAEDELGVYMHVDGFRLYIRQDDVSLAKGMPISEFHPFINSVQKE